MRGLLGINCFLCYKYSDSIANNDLRLRSPDPYTLILDYIANANLYDKIREEINKILENIEKNYN